jgi:pimeloyl-ACP methyl ester carboxylesterase
MFVYAVPKPSYEYVKDDPTMIFVPNKNETKVSTTSSSFDNSKIQTKIPCRYIQCQTRPSPYLIIFFHGNSEDIGSSLSYLLSSFGDRFAMNVLCPEYPTYGIYKKKDDGMRMDKAILEDARSVLKYAHTQLRFKYENIILIGRSLGSGVAVKLATEFNVKGMVLISPYTSIRCIAKTVAGNLLSKLVPNAFRSIDYINHIKCPALFIHGVQDSLIPHGMSIELYNKAPGPKVLKINDSMTHNQFKLESDIFTPIQSFMREKLTLKSYIFEITSERMTANFESMIETNSAEEPQRQQVSYEEEEKR